MTHAIALAGWVLIVGGLVVGLMAAAERYDRLTAWAQRLLDAPRDDDRGER